MGFEDFPPAFLSTPKSQPCVRGVFRAVFKVTINEARPAVGCRNSSSDPCVRIPSLLAPSHVPKDHHSPKEGHLCADSRQISSSVKLYLVPCTAKFALPLSAADGCSLSAALGHLVAASTCSSGFTADLWCFLQEICQKTGLNQKDILCLYFWGYNDFIH